MKKIFLLILILVIFSSFAGSIEFNFNETDFVDIQLEAYDPDGDKLDYTFDAPLDENGQWQTTYGDAGIYDVEAVVSDGENEVVQKITIIVDKKEEKPVIESFSPEEDIVISEGDTIEFKIEVSDLNNDELIYEWSKDGENISDKSSYTYETGYFDAGEYTFNVVVSDGTNEVEKEWHVVVENKDRMPEFKEPVVSNAVLSENERIEIILNAEDPDEEEITYLAEGLPEGASLEDNKFIWQTDYDSVGKDNIMNDVASKFHLLQKSFNLKFIAQSNGASVEKEFVITVKDVNRAPVLEEIDEIIVNEGDVVEINANAFDPDGDKVNYYYSGWMESKSYTAKKGDAGKHIVKVAASDGFLTDTKDAIVVVNRANKAPVISLADVFEVSEGNMLSFKVDASDADENSVTLEATGLPDGAYFNDNMFRWRSDFDSGGRIFNISFKASDGISETDKNVFIKVLDKNRAPKIYNVSPSGEITVYQGSEVRFDVFASDPDGDELSYRWPVSFFKSYFGSSAMLRKFNALGKKEVEVVVSDGKDPTSYKWKVNVVEKS